ncbi:MAG TPA: alpha-2-macroglobulin family protein [Bryocella sp.]|nr:alpha-2-macroglobulin family protein [Bryocella sp.]
MFRARCFFVVLCAAALPMQAQDEMTATYVHHALEITVPYHGVHQGAGHLEVTLLSPEDKILARSVSVVKASAANGIWQAELTPERTLPFDDLVWERVRSRVSFEGEQTPAIVQIRSVSTILRHPVVHLLGQTNYLAGAPAALRVIVTDGTPNASLVTNGTVRIELAKGPHTILFTGKLDRRGSTNAEFRFPDRLNGETALRITAETPLGTAETVETIHLEDKVSILLTTEKPIYQPSQTIHVRALALDRADHHAAPSREITFELEDARGNRIFRKQTETDSFGVASAEFILADEVNLGAWHLHASLPAENDEVAHNNTAELTVQVERYVLPKFRVSINLAQKDGQPQRDFRPGDHVTGTVEAKYFFGKPVSNATIELKATGMDATIFNAAKSEGRTNADGKYNFNLTLPTYFAARSGNRGIAPAIVEAAVRDTAGHIETHDEPITVSESPLLIQAVPEGGQLVPNLDNTVYIITSYPDGTPAQTTVRVRTKAKADQTANTGVNGIAVVHLQGSAGNDQLRCEADDHHGRRTLASVQLQERSGEDQLLLHTDYAVYRPGQTMKLKLLSTRARTTGYVDIIKDGQTVLTRDVDLDAGHAELSVPVTSSLSGTLELNAYIFGANSQPVQDHRLIFVEPAQDLRIEAHADRASYLPGADAHVSFHVTDSHGKGVEAALGLEIVDEAVFALAEKQPGFAKVFFYLEQELMKPHFEIHSLSPGQIVTQPADSRGNDGPAAQDQAARVLFSAAESVNPHTLNTTFGNDPSQAQRYVFASRYMEILSDNASLLAPQLHDRVKGKSQNIEQTFSSLRDSSGAMPHDAWDTPLRLQRTYGWGNRYFNIVSAGPDRRFGTEDDLAVIIDLNEGALYVPPGRRGAIAVEVEHDRGPFNGLAQIGGTVVDTSGAVVAGAQVRLEAIANGEVRRAVVDHTGEWALTGLPAGAYRVTISSPGFTFAAHTLTVAARDQAILRATLYAVAVSETVAVMAGAPVVETDEALANMVMRFSAGTAMASPQPRAQFMLRTVAKTAPAAPDVQTEAHTRSYFPEALFIAPEIVTDNHGNASASFPVADSITTWRMAIFASTRNGALGSASSSLKVFEDFFVDLDLPVTITQGDRISIPVAIYNYTDKAGDAQLQLQPEAWFDLADANSHKDVNVSANTVGSSSFTIQAKHIGRFKLTLAAYMGSRQDTVVREIDVVPDGQQREIVFNGRLDGSSQSAAAHTVSFPSATLPESTSLFVRLYPGPLSQIAEGMDGVLRMPFGCFEQTSSSTYPNVLALDYMKRNKRITPEIRAKAEGFIATGYQRLLSFEVPGGGFSWFGQAPANKVLTAYGLMEFYDMSAVHDVDPRVIERTRDWLIALQQPDGSWKPDTQFINEGATNRFNTDLVRITAYIAWSLETTGYDGPAVDKARGFLRTHLADSSTRLDAYTLAVLANFAVHGKGAPDWTHEILGRLMDAAHAEGDQLWWTSEETGVYATGNSAAVETTGLAVQALLISGEQNAAARKALTWLLSKKNGDGNWGSTQATIMALRALVMASEKSGGDAVGDVEILLDGHPFKAISLTKENNDLLQQFVLPANASPHVQIRFHGTGGLAYQVDGQYFIPWNNRKNKDALSIDVAYDRTRLAESDMVSATATIHSNLNKQANMVMVDLGIPPGFDLQTEDLQSMVESTAHARTGRLEKFNLTATQAILYFNGIAGGETVKVQFHLHAKYPIRAKAFASRVYEYYDPAVSATARPAIFEVTVR